MELVQPYASLLDVATREDGIRLLQKIEWCARISHRSEDAQGEDTWERFLRSVIVGHGDWSVVEHVSVTVRAVVDRGIMAEWTRHRIGAYTVESSRFTNYAKKLGLSFIEPPGLDDGGLRTWEKAMYMAEASYGVLIASGDAPQIARSVLPMALATNMVVTYNLRNWRHFFLLRTTKETHPQMRHVTIPLLAQFQERIPILFEDIVPNAKQVTNLSKPR